MGVLLDDAASEYLYHDAAVLATKPLTIAGWINRDDDTVHCSLASICNSGSAVNYFALMCLNVGHGFSNQAFFQVRDAGNSYTAYSGVSNIAPAAGNWFHIAGTINNSYIKYAYINGGRGSAQGSIVDPSGVDITGIGVNLDSTPSWHLSGSMAELGFWDIDLTADEIMSLAKRYSPLLVRPQNLVAYWPLIREMVN